MLENKKKLHVAVIMDGNGRWATSRNLPRKLGHKEGAKAMKRAIEAAEQLGIDYITFYVFSSENWDRPPSEINSLMSLLKEYFTSKDMEKYKKKYRIITSGRLDRLEKSISDNLIQLTKNTEQNRDSMTINLAIDYSGRSEIINATKNITQKVLDGELSIDEIDENVFQDNLYNQIPDVDLLIRTAGEYRISNFLLWQTSYAEFHILDKYWPDFQKQDLIDSLEVFKKRVRKFGNI